MSLRIASFIILLALGILVTPPAAEAQQPRKVPHIGFLSSVSANSVRARLEALRLGLRDLGWVEGQSITIDYRLADGRNDRLPSLAEELVRLKVDVIVTHGVVATLAARRATSAIPIVFASADDAVAAGLVASLARPGGNVTGLTVISPELSGKRLELLREVIPTLTRLAVLRNPTNPVSLPELKETQVAAQTLGLLIQSLEVTDPGGFAGAFSAMTREQAGALIVLSDAMFTGRHAQIVDHAAKSRLPAIYWTREFVDAGGLMSYGPNFADLWRRAAAYVDKILKGAKPADLPVEQPRKFEQVINLKTAKAPGLTIPQSVLIRADQIIQ
jgi:putative ABC transport system substrate-binding protein